MRSDCICIIQQRRFYKTISYHHHIDLQVTLYVRCYFFFFIYWWMDYHAAAVNKYSHLVQYSTNIYWIVHASNRSIKINHYANIDVWILLWAYTYMYDERLLNDYTFAYMPKFTTNKQHKCVQSNVFFFVVIFQCIQFILGQNVALSLHVNLICAFT